jgi:hypothetical protein
MVMTRRGLSVGNKLALEGCLKGMTHLMLSALRNAVLLLWSIRIHEEAVNYLGSMVPAGYTVYSGRAVPASSLQFFACRGRTYDTTRKLCYPWNPRPSEVKNKKTYKDVKYILSILSQLCASKSPKNSSHTQTTSFNPSWPRAHSCNINIPPAYLKLFTSF